MSYPKPNLPFRIVAAWDSLSFAIGYAKHGQWSMANIMFADAWKTLVWREYH